MLIVKPRYGTRIDSTRTNWKSEHLIIIHELLEDAKYPLESKNM
jgi:hypothetical protein